MKTIDKNFLLETLVNVKSATFMQVVYVGEVKMRKTGNPFVNPILKRTNINVSFFGSYENAVNNRLKKAGLEADFKAQPLMWGEWFVANKIIQHKDEKYVRMYLHKNSYNGSTTEYFYNGDLLTGKDLELAKSFFTEKSESKRQSEAGLEDEEQSKPFTVKLSNIRQVKINNEVYNVI